MGVANSGLFDTTTGLNDLRHTITINSGSSGLLTIGMGQSYNTVSCGTWAANWQNERVLDNAFDVDPSDTRSTMRGSGEISFANGVAVFKGSPRLYVSPEEGIDGWDDVVITAYAKYVDQGAQPYKSYSGLTIATRTKHDNYQNDPCDAFGYYARIYQESGECSFQKEYYHSTDTGTVYSGTNRVDCFPGGLPLGKWVGMKFKVKTVGDDVKLELYLDMNDDGNWELKHSLTDTTGSWFSTSSATVPGKYGFINNIRYVYFTI